MATINNIGGFVHTIADNPPVARGSPSPSAWTGAARPLHGEFVQLTHKKNRLVNERLERLETTQTETSGSIGWTAAPATSKATTTNERPAIGSWPSPRPVLNSKPPPGPAPERPRNSTAISIDQRCWKYCEDRLRPSVGPRHHGHSLLTLADAIRPEPSAT